jgi:hypothetical protein
VLSRRGATLAELIAAIVLAAIVLGTATRSVLHQQRTQATLGGLASAESQLRMGLDHLPAALAELSAEAGDLTAGEASDTALQLRAPVTTGFACDGESGRATLDAGLGSDGRGAEIASEPQAGDTLWWYPGAPATWVGRSLVDVRPSTGSCALTGQVGGAVLRLAVDGVDSIPRGAPVRITRPVRYVIYRAGDGTWQLGLRDWSDAAHRFAPPQPLAGPFVRRLGTGERTGFRYFDANGAELLGDASGVEVARIARKRMMLLAPVPYGESGGAHDSVRRDSIDVALPRAGRG